MTKDEMIKNCLSQFDEKELIDLASALIKLPSFPPDFNEKDVALVAAEKFREYGIDFGLDELGNNRANIRAWMGEKESPGLWLSGHLDTVPPVDEGWDHDPFGAEIEDGKLYGRGACDMKGGDACLIMAMCLIKKAGIKLNGKLAYLGTAGEDFDFKGSLSFMEKYGSDDIDAMIIAEASGGDMYIAEKGIVQLDLVSYGKAAHPGVSWEGVNSLLNMLKFMEKFRKYEFTVKDHPLLGAPTLNITYMHAGEIVNTLPVVCTAACDIRTVPGIVHKDILDYARNIISEMKAEDPAVNIECEMTLDIPAISTDPEDPLCKAAHKASLDTWGRDIEEKGVFFGTDAAVMQHSDGSNAPLVIYGPGNPSNNHKVNEYVGVQELVDAVKFYVSMIVNYMAVEG